jgi:hypothetical protein
MLLEYLKRPPNRPRHKWSDNIEMSPKESGYESVKGIHVGKDRVQLQVLVNTNLQVPSKVGNLLTS